MRLGGYNVRLRNYAQGQTVINSVTSVTECK
ncbi:hypothetical protein CBM2589_A10087 [Cupriavidus taiwanensis]|uniref:Uncharacterized protein n=1 Tax=Cupriavidus taiwanensis TaxID=164546 RepID=A0A375BYC6_9BURK|nr:hypothetical protein CBM2589_A10087 [Cupriavidus taiwanensis]